MTEKYKCGDAGCWCATSTGLVVQPAVARRRKARSDEEKRADAQRDLRMEPNHKGYVDAMMGRK